jgi:hypothetical protein
MYSWLIILLALWNVVSIVWCDKLCIQSLKKKSSVFKCIFPIIVISSVKNFAYTIVYVRKCSVIFIFLCFPSILPLLLCQRKHLPWWNEKESLLLGKKRTLALLNLHGYARIMVTHFNWFCRSYKCIFRKITMDHHDYDTAQWWFASYKCSSTSCECVAAWYNSNANADNLPQLWTSWWWIINFLCWALGTSHECCWLWTTTVIAVLFLLSSNQLKLAADIFSFLLSYNFWLANLRLNRESSLCFWTRSSLIF